MLITENQLDEWARSNAENAKGLIVELVWRLVAASSPKPHERRFPLSDSIGQHGPDGVLDATISYDPFVPEHRSYWEIGAGRDAQTKATGDYKGLTENTPESVRLDATFIFVSPRSGRTDWEATWKPDAQLTWINDRRNRKEWRDVRVIDGTRLVDWLSKFPAVEFWLAQKISGIQPEQIDVPAQHWGVISSIGEPPPLPTDLFLVNRDDAGSKLKEVLDGTTVQLKLTTHYPEQVVDFVTAYLMSLDEEKRVEALGKCLIVSSIDTWERICNQPEWKNHILIADSRLDLNGDTGIKLIQKARIAGHAVIFGGPFDGIPDPASVRLLMPHSYQIQESLQKAGYSEERARVLAQKSDGNLGSLLRCIQNLSVLPAWADRSDAAELAVAMLLGSWNEKSTSDQRAVEDLSGKAYGEWIRGMRDIVLDSATPLIQRDGSWKFLARYEGWYSLGRHVFDEHLSRLKNVITEVLAEKDPKFELAPDERFTASINGKALSHSQALRSGLAETLALLGSHPDALTSSTNGKAETTAFLITRDILADANWILWASVNDLLPLLAEAAPKAFLDAVEDALQRDPCPFDEVFAQEGKGLGGGGNYLTGLLWGLETLAWDSDYLSRVVICLGELAMHDPGGRWANRPDNSLRTIFLPWLPQTCAPISKRVAAIKTLMNEFPSIGWKLLMDLLPQQPGFSSGTRRPAWREIIPDEWRDGVTYQELWDQVIVYADLAISYAKSDRSKLGVLVEHMESLPPQAHDQLLDYLKSDAILELSVDEKFSLWNKLVDLISHHRKYADAKWAMKPGQIDTLAAVANRLAPSQPALHYQRLFSERDLNLIEEKGDYESQMSELEKRREAAIGEIAESGGIDAVLAFVQTVQSPWRAGIAFGFIANSDSEHPLLPELLQSDAKSLLQFVGGFVWGRFRSLGWIWVDGLKISDWSATQKGQFFCFLPFTREAWERVKVSLGDEQGAYWAKTAANPYEANNDLEYAIDQLIEFGRPLAAIGCFNKILYDKKPLNGKLATRALLAALGSAENQNTMDAFEIAEIIKELQTDPMTNQDELFQVEWAYLPLLDGYHEATPKLLWQRLANDPAFFCEVIRVVFRSKKEDQSAKEITEDKKKIATNAYRLLSEWHRPPGLRDDGSYDGDALEVWLNIVQKDCSESGHLDVAMSMVGHVLIYVPPDPDGLWIHRSAANVLNAKDAQRLRAGFHTELYNSRGVHWIDPAGKPERELAEKYRSQAEAVENAGYQRLAGTLRELATAYEQDAQRNSSQNEFDN